MQINLNYWKALVVMLPFVAALTLMSIEFSPGNRILAEITNYLVIISLLIAVSCQTCMLIGFIKVTNNNDQYFKINALIPVAFLIAYLLYLIFLSFTKHLHTASTSQTGVHSKSGPIGIAEIHGINLVILLFLIYTFINFLFTNNNYVSWQIKKITDTEKQAELRNDYLKPMRTLVRTAIYVFGISILITMVTDILRIV